MFSTTSRVNSAWLQAWYIAEPCVAVRQQSHAYRRAVQLPLPLTNTAASLSLRRSANPVGPIPVRILAYTDQPYWNKSLLANNVLLCACGGLCWCVSAMFSVSECVCVPRFIELLSLASFSVSCVLMRCRFEARIVYFSLSAIKKYAQFVRVFVWCHQLL